MVLMVGIVILNGELATRTYNTSRTFSEPMFAFAIMPVAGSRPILHFCRPAPVSAAARLLPVRRGMECISCRSVSCRFSGVDGGRSCGSGCSEWPFGR